jgi:hypothetical protein
MTMIGRRATAHLFSGRSLAKSVPGTQAMAAGVADHVWTYEEISVLLD